MTTDMILTNLAIRMAYDHEIKRALQDPGQEVIEWISIQYTFVMSPAQLVIVRGGAFGGDARVIHGGWKYVSPIHMAHEWTEIGRAARVFVPWKRQV